MRLLIVSEVFWPEDFIINDLAQEWIKMGYEVEVITQYPSYPYSQVFEGYKNKGYTTEAFKKVIEFLFSLGVHKVIASHLVGNDASRRVMEKCGLIYEG